MLRRVQPQPPGHACITRNCGAPRCRDPAVQSTEYTCTLQTNPRRALRTGCHGAAALPVEPPPPTARARGPSVYRRSVRPMMCGPPVASICRHDYDSSTVKRMQSHQNHQCAMPNLNNLAMFCAGLVTRFRQFIVARYGLYGRRPIYSSHKP